MDARTLRLLGLDAPAEGGSTYSGQFSGLPQPLANPSAPSFSAGGLNRNVASPYRQTGGIVLPFQETAANPGELDEGLRTTMQAGHQGWMDRGANAFLGGGFNPWAMEYGGPEGQMIAPSSRDAEVNNLFEIAGQLGLDTSKYSKDLGHMGMRGERSGEMDAMQLYDDLNDYTKDYVSVGGLSNGWSGGPDNTVSRTIYKEVDGRLVPVTEPKFHGRQSNNGFFDKEFMGMMSTVGLAALGGALAAPAAAGSSAAGSAAGGTAASTAGTGALSGAWSSLPQWGQRALTGALQGGLSSGVQGGNILEGALTGGVTGAAGGFVGDTVKGLNLGLPDWATQGLTRGITGGLGSALRGGDVLSGALSGAVSGGLQGAGLPSGLASIGGRLVGSQLADSGGSGGGGGQSPLGGSGGVGALTAATGGGGGASRAFDPNDARIRAAIMKAALNRVGRAGDTRGDNPLTRALEDAAQG